MSKSPKAKYCIGQLIQHKLFDYRGIILSVDLEFKSTDEWYEACLLYTSDAADE